MKLEFKRRINLLQIYYRHKKYGEPLVLISKVEEAEDID